MEIKFQHISLITILILFNLSSCNSQHRPNEEIVRNNINRFTENLYQLLSIVQYYKMNPTYVFSREDSWTFSNSGLQMRNILQTIKRHYGNVTFSDVNLNRQIQSLINSPLAPLTLTDVELQRLIALYIQLTRNESMQPKEIEYKSNPSCQGPNCSTTKLGTEERKEVVRKLKDATDIRYYWENLFSNNFTKNTFEEFLNMYKKGYRRELAGNTLGAWYAEYEDANFLEEISKAVRQVRPLYEQLHAYLRNDLRKKFPGSQINPRDPIPEHFLEQIFLWIEDSDYGLEYPYPNDRLLNVTEVMRHQHWTSRKILDVSNDFFESLGMRETFSEYWYPKNLQLPNAMCHNLIHAMRDEYTLQYCPDIDYRAFLNAHMTFAKIRYIMQSGGLAMGLNKEPSPGFGDGIGIAAVLSAISPKHLNKLGLMTHSNLTRKQTINQLYDIAFDSLWGLQRLFVYEKFWTDILLDNIIDSDYNCHFWRLQNDLAGIMPPGDRTSDQLDLPEEFYQNIPITGQSTKNIMKLLLGFQIFKSFCLSTGQYVPGNPSKPLHACDYSGDKTIGSKLSHAMSLGRTKSWRDVLEVLTGERTLNAGAILEYFQPLQVWLEEENRNNNAEVGWITVDRCKSKPRNTTSNPTNGYREEWSWTWTTAQ